MAIVLVLLALMVRYSALPEVEGDDDEADADEVKRTSLLQYPYLWFGVVALFFYVGAEVVAVDTLISYGNSLGFELAEAKFFSSFTLGGMIVGYFFGIFLIPKFISQQKALTYFSILGVIFTLIAITTDGYTSILFIAALGFANSIMWPAIWPLAIDGLGKFIKTGSALLIMAIAGGATIPLLYGYLAGMENVGNRLAYVILVPCYLIILYFATKGHKIGKKIKNN